jgi:hypothetical protein
MLGDKITAKMKLPDPLETVDISVQPIQRESIEVKRTSPIPGLLSSWFEIHFATGLAAVVGA